MAQSSDPHRGDGDGITPRAMVAVTVPEIRKCGVQDWKLNYAALCNIADWNSEYSKPKSDAFDLFDKDPHLIHELIDAECKPQDIKFNLSD